MQATSDFDVDRFRKVASLVNGGATEGERAAARDRASKIAAKAGLSFEQAMSRLDEKKTQPVNFFAGFDDWMEEKHPGWKAERAREKSKREIRDDARRRAVLRIYGTEKALFARNEREAKLDAAIAPLAKWEYWTDDDGVDHRHAEGLDGKEPMFWSVDEITPAIRKAVISAYPWPCNLDDALQEVKDWDRLRLDRGLFCGEWNHYAEVECRMSLLERELDSARPASSWQDMQARFDWKRYKEERQWIDPIERADPFMDRLEADFRFLRSLHESEQLHSPHVQTGRRTNADKRAAVLSMLDAEPALSDREISRRVGVSPQTVNNWRKRMSHQIER